MSIFEDQADFMSLGGQGIAPKLISVSAEQLCLYANLIAEEAEEFAKEFESPTSPTNDIKEAVDVIVVAAGYLISRIGVVGAQKAWNAVLESNLAKTRGKLEMRADGKILKNQAYKEQAKKELESRLAEIAKTELF